MRIRACDAVTRTTLSIRGDTLIAVCHRHDARLERALGMKVRAARPRDLG